MMNKKLLSEMNEQINKEIYSGYLYLAMAAHFEAQNLGGFAKWMELQAQEELEHGMKFYSFLNDLGERVQLKAIDQPQTEFGTPKEIFEQVIEHEKFVTGRIHLLYDMAVSEKDYAAQVFLQWFVNEQVEEEKNATEILGSLKLAGDSANFLFMLNKTLGERKGE
jgi:ferritin